jgi:hypothetical protein
MYVSDLSLRLLIEKILYYAYIASREGGYVEEGTTGLPAPEAEKAVSVRR